MKITPDVNNWGYFIERCDHFIKDSLLGIWNILILRLRSLSHITQVNIRLHHER